MIYDYSVKDQNGQMVSLDAYKGRVLIVVNTATQCGFTPQYPGLQALYAKYHDQGLDILDFPCDQFGHQAPGSDEDIHSFCTGRFGVTFPQFSKIDVNGEQADPLFVYLEGQKGFAGFTGEKAAFMEDFIAKKHPDYKETGDIKWNFTKFLVNRDGEVVARYESTVEPEAMEDDIKALL
ncbi:MAG: glutathione peroxidase [Erysipelotrichaceae bacterium]|nr:glutathione peroxidase [Erysipelotrichaceae bacterium]